MVAASLAPEICTTPAHHIEHHLIAHLQTPYYTLLPPRPRQPSCLPPTSPWKELQEGNASRD